MRASRLARLLALLALVTPGLASAHPMGNFSISHHAAIHVAPDGVGLRYVLDLAEIPTFQILQAEGLAGDAESPEARAYLLRAAETLADGLTLELDGRRLALRKEAAELTFPRGAGGLPTLRLAVAYRVALPREDAGATAALTYRDGNYPERAGWKEIVATAAPGVTLVASTVPEQDQSRALSDYPTDPAVSPPQALEARVVFARTAPAGAVARSASPPATPGRGAPAAGAARPVEPPARNNGPADDQGLPSSAISALHADRELAPSATAAAAPGPTATGRGASRDRFAALIAGRPVGPGMVLFALAVAASLGAFHALEPGHGKTVVAAYLVGARGTARHALLLGLVVTAAHTLGVYLLGIVTLYASRHVVPERLYPWLGAASGLLITLLGVSLLWRRLGGPFLGARGGAHGRSHGDQEHPADPAADHEDLHARGLEHSHGPGHGHHHHHLPDGPVSLRALVALGVSGGIVPCPAALVVLLSAVAMGRVGFGLLLIVAFSVGLAAVLVGIGLLVVWARRLAARLNRAGVEGPLVRRWLPVTSAAVITLSGVVITVQALGG
jgi:ABC-type nickel/cobalt efflux system permease component RcnA